MTKYFIMKSMTFVLLALGFALFANCDKKSDVPFTDSLSQAEINDLLYLREEEKLARDVYLYSKALYGIRIFSNISNSEQRHMDKVLGLLEKYGISGPVSAEEGVFNNPELQNLYDELTAKSALSLLDALVVGATIEDLDIRDIEAYEARTAKSDLLSVYSSLKCGSRNHIRAYSSQITSNGDTYVPQYLSQMQYEDIINESHESCGF
jgi:hypothetical protein